MEKKKNIAQKDSLNENSLKAIYAKYFGEYQPDEYSPKSEPKQSKESEMDEGKLFTRFIMKK